MTIEQFISKLQEFPKDAEVAIPSVDMHGHATSYAPNPKYYENYNKVYLE